MSFFPKRQKADFSPRRRLFFDIAGGLEKLSNRFPIIRSTNTMSGPVRLKSAHAPFSTTFAKTFASRVSRSHSSTYTSCIRIKRPSTSYRSCQGIRSFRRYTPDLPTPRSSSNFYTHIHNLFKRAEALGRCTSEASTIIKFTPQVDD